MFEKWIDRILENKLKVKSILHLGTEFEYTRTVDDHNKIVDPFVPKFDLTKIKDLSKEITKSQKVNVESPRFINTLRIALNQIFIEADKSKTGLLTYAEFEDAFKNLSYGLQENDVQTLIALADENDEGKICWEDFIPIGIEAIKSFFLKNKMLLKHKDKNVEINKEAMKHIYMDEIKKSDEILQKRFKRADPEELGHISIPQLKQIFADCKLLTPKEINGFV